MKTFKTFYLSVIFGLLIAFSVQECIHERIKIKPKPVPDKNAEGAGRFHQLRSDNWGPLRILADFTFFEGTSAQRDYIQQMLLPAALDYFKASLKVPQVSRLMNSEDKICDFSTPAIYKTTGVAADLVLMVTGSHSNESWVAFATPCLLLESTGRPIFGWINFNLDIVEPTTGSNFESDVLTAMHEITHVLGISSSLYDFFPAQKTIGQTISNGKVVTYIDLPPLTERVRKHFNCGSIKGAYLENQGGEGSAGSHLERRIFMNDYMTASVINDQRVSEFSLAFLEGSGWYQVNYEMADPFLWGKNEGCSFLDGTCFGTAFSEFCDEFGSTGCDFHRTYGSFCGSPRGSSVLDQFADNCPFYSGYSNANCQDPKMSDTRILSAEVYGQHSRCFSGTIFPNATLTRKRAFCLNYNCKKQADGKYQLAIDLGTAQPLCHSKGNITVDGYQGNFECPDPDDFCAGVGQKFCKRGCTGRGKCSNGICQCEAGYSGPACMTKVDAFLDGVDILEPQFDPYVDVVGFNDDLISSRTFVDF